MHKAVLLLALILPFFFINSTLAHAKNSPKQTALPSSHQPTPLGMNTNEAMETDASLPFIDLFRFAMPFESARPWLTKGEIDYDEHGWPSALNGGQVGTRFLNNIPVGALPAGTYTVRYEGEGRLQYGGAAKLIESSPGVDLIRLESLDNKTITATLYIMQSNPQHYVRNIRILMSGGICQDQPFQRVDSAESCGDQNTYQAFADHYDDITFNPAYLNFMKDFGVIRFMNMSGVTRNDLRYWQYRPNLNEATWGGPEGQRGVPIEIMVKLANQLHINPWFNMPHNAGDDYIKRFAAYVKKHLNPDLNVYLEYTNEAWNAMFVPQAEHMKQKGTRAKLDVDRRVAGFKYYSKQSVHIFKLWEDMFEGTDRLVRVMGGMTTDPAMTEIILAYQNAYQYVDALAIAPYFYIDQDQLGAIESVDDVFDLLAASDNRYSIENLMKIIRQQAETTGAYGVDLVAYEGGQHLVDHKTHKMTEGATPYLVAANRDPRMAKAYHQLLTGWKDVGGKLFVAFSAPRPPTWHGSWGIKEYINQPDAEAPKYRALLAFSHDEPCWWPGCANNQLVRQPKPELVPQSLVTGEAAIPQAQTSVTIKRGDADDLQAAKPQRVTTLIKGTLRDSEDLAAAWRASWDDRTLNLAVEIYDDQLMEDSEQAWADDSVEIYIDANGSRADTYDGEDDFQLVFRRKDPAISLSGSSPQRNISGIKYKMVKTASGYRLAANIPWELLGIEPEVGLKMGFDVHINDDDNGHSRDAKISWNAPVDQAWKNPELFGEVVLRE